MPITITAARTVGNILRWIPNGIPPQKPYRFYMYLTPFNYQLELWSV